MLSLSGHDRQVLHLVTLVLRSHRRRRKTGWRERMKPKLVLALGPWRLRAASSWARVAFSAVSKVPSHLWVFFQGSRISAAKRPHGLFRMPLGLGFEQVVGLNGF